MNMKRNIYRLFVFAVVALIAAVACQRKYTLYSDAEYIMFADTAYTYPVLIEEEYFEVPVAATKACDYDRTIAVEVIDTLSTAQEGFHYVLKSNNVVIKAGETSAVVYIKGVYGNFTNEDNLHVTLSLVMDESLYMPMYSKYTKVNMRKSPPFDIKDFTGWCVMTSQFLYDYSQSSWYQRLVWTELLPSEENTIICRDLFYDGYDVLMKFDPKNPADYQIHIPADQVISDEGSVFGISYGDDHILISTTSSYPSYFYTTMHTVVMWSRIYVKDLAEDYGTLGTYYNIMEWVSAEEADRIRKEDGMPASPSGPAIK